MTTHGQTDARRASLDEERAVNERYLRAMRATAERRRRNMQEMARPRNLAWTGSGSARRRTPIEEVALSPLIGRVALEEGDPQLGRGFYVGPGNQEWDGVQVVNWAARVAALFFEGRDAKDPAAKSVLGRRTFVVRGEDLAGFVDDLEAEAARGNSDPFASPSAALSIPRAPSRSTSPVRHLGSPLLRPTQPSQAKPPDEGGEPAARPAPGRNGASARRAESALRAALEQPRNGRLASVLATLQADQYRLVTRPATEPLVVQGGPGTGKTVVAVHRAAYLTHPDQQEPLQRVALVGPTREFVDHVREAIAELQAGDGGPPGRQTVLLRSLPGFLRSVAGVSREAEPTHERATRLDGDWQLGRFADAAVRALKRERALPAERTAALRAVVAAIIGRRASVREVLRRYGEVEEWCADLRSFDQMRTSSRYQPFLAAVAMALRPPDEHSAFDHLLVDEAQDVQPLEWRILVRHLRPGGQLSLFGDINQRRSDWSPASWVELAADLELGAHLDRFRPEVLEVGYRTTQQILRFANQLLPRAERDVRAVRSGAEPAIIRVGDYRSITDAARRRLVDTVLEEAARLAGEHRMGQVAVVSRTPKLITDAMRKASWSRDQRGAWRHGAGAPVHVLHPDAARGLEFDGVIVVEPANFPPNLGRHGLLYTSLTRAVQSLVVVHALPLPKELKASRS